MNFAKKGQSSNPGPGNSRCLPALGLDQDDWNFDSVPEEELHVCCLWEYGRESNFLRSIRERSVEAARLQLPFRERLDFVERDFSKAFGALGRSACLFQVGIYCLGGDKGYPGVISRFPEAWQSLSKSERSVLLETADWDVKKVSGFPGFRRSNVPRADALVKLFRPKSMKEVFGRDEGVGVREYFHAGHKLRSLCPCYMYPSGMEVLLVEIEWGDFTNEQLVQEFAQWLKENDPPGLSRPDKRGHKKISDRVKLERLGIMRLLNRFTPAELGTACPDAWKRYNSPNRRWRKDASMAGIHFRELFPFLPEEETPLAWPPKETCAR
jgi:hypothetical protein